MFDIAGVLRFDRVIVVLEAARDSWSRKKLGTGQTPDMLRDSKCMAAEHTHQVVVELQLHTEPEA